MADFSTYTGTIRMSLGSANADLATHLDNFVANTGTMHTAKVALIGPGKYFQAYAVYEP